MTAILFLLGSAMVVVAVKLYLLSIADDIEIGILSYDHIVHEHDLTFAQCPVCGSLFDWIEIEENYPNLSSQEIDDHMASVGIQCPVCLGIDAEWTMFWDRFDKEQEALRQSIADSTG